MVQLDSTTLWNLREFVLQAHYCFLSVAVKQVRFNACEIRADDWQTDNRYSAIRQTNNQNQREPTGNGPVVESESFQTEIDGFKCSH